MERTLFREEHELFRKAFRGFVEREVRPHQARWNEAGRSTARRGERRAPRPPLPVARGEVRRAGRRLPPLGGRDRGARARYESGFALPLHSDVVVPYIHEFGTEAQKQRWLPGCASGDLVTAIAMTEPGTGSDLAALQTRAVKDGDDYVITGAKTFISNGILCDLCIVAAKTDPDPANAHRGISLFVVEAERPGFVRGQEAQEDGHGVAGHRRARRSRTAASRPRTSSARRAPGFFMLMRKLQQERLVVALGSQAAAEQVLDGHDRVHARSGRRSASRSSKFQNSQFKLVECATQDRGGARVPRSPGRRARGRQAPGQGVLDGEALAHRDGVAR